MKKAVLIVVALSLLVLGSLAGYRFARQQIFWELGDQLGIASEEAGQVQVHTEGEVEEKKLQDAKKAAAAFNDFANRYMGASLKRPVELYVSGDEASYQIVLEREFSLSPEEAARVAAISGGWSGGNIHVAAINASAGVMSGHGDRYSTTGHELFHQLQYELSHGKDTEKKALFWLEEGGADYVGALLSESLGGTPFWKWQSDVKAELTRVKSMVSPQELQHCTLEQRKELMGKEYHTYRVADMMTIYLMGRYPEEERGARLAAYYHALAEVGKGEEAFQQAFGQELADFLQEFGHWWQSFRQQPVVFHYREAESKISRERAEAVMSELEASQAWLQRNLGGQITGEYQVVLTEDVSSMTKALAEYTELPQEKAESLAAHSLCVENGGLLVLNAGNLQNEQQRAFSLGMLVMRTYEGQVLADAKGCGYAWLIHGAAYLAGTSRQSAASGYAVADFMRSNRKKLEGLNLPRVEYLQSEEDFRKAVEKYGDENITALTELAAYDLIKAHGWGSFANYLQETALTRDGVKAFKAVYGR